MAKNVTEKLAKFCAELKFENLPEDVVHEAKQILLDIVGCALGSVELDKGRIAVEVAREIGGRPEATILGIGAKVAAPVAAFANGELMHSMDFCSLMPPAHVAPFVSAAPLALAESRKVSGKNLIIAFVLAHEIASRIGVSLGPMRAKKGGLPIPSWGLGCDEFGAAIGAAKILGLDSEKMAHAIGLSGYFAPVPSHTKHLYTPNAGFGKYGPAGWTAQGGVTIALMVEKGYRGDRQVLEGKYGYWVMNGSKKCDWNAITGGLGEDWNILEARFKKWPCCGNFQSSLEAFTWLINEYDLKPEEIEKVTLNVEEQNFLPLFQFKEIQNHVDAQFSMHYNIAAAAHRIKVGPNYQARKTIENPSILAFMKKVEMVAYPKAEETRYQECVVEGKPYINRRPALVQVVARGKTFTRENEYVQWLSIYNPEYKATDADLAGKFRANAENVLSNSKINKAIDMILNLEKVVDINELIKVLVR